MTKNKSAIICPYPGLRPFTEQESLYFKGRDKHIKKIKTELEQKKYLMVTGASGDGKSSLIYAGLIPNIRAGFFKAKYNSWKVAVFRPGNDPLNNLATVILHSLICTRVLNYTGVARLTTVSRLQRLQNQTSVPRLITVSRLQNAQVQISY